MVRCQRMLAVCLLLMVSSARVTAQLEEPRVLNVFNLKPLSEFSADKVEIPGVSFMLIKTSTTPEIFSDPINVTITASVNQDIIKIQPFSRVVAPEIKVGYAQLEFSCSIQLNPDRERIGKTLTGHLRTKFTATTNHSQVCVGGCHSSGPKYVFKETKKLQVSVTPRVTPMIEAESGEYQVKVNVSKSLDTLQNIRLKVSLVSTGGVVPELRRDQVVTLNATQTNSTEGVEFTNVIAADYSLNIECVKDGPCEGLKQWINLPRDIPITAHTPFSVLNRNIYDLNNEVQNLNNTIQNLTNTNKNLNKILGKTIKSLNNTVKGLNKTLGETIASLNTAVENLVTSNETIRSLNHKIQVKINRTRLLETQLCCFLCPANQSLADQKYVTCDCTESWTEQNCATTTPTTDPPTTTPTDVATPTDVITTGDPNVTFSSGEGETTIIEHSTSLVMGDHPSPSFWSGHYTQLAFGGLFAIIVLLLLGYLLYHYRIRVKEWVCSNKDAVSNLSRPSFTSTLRRVRGGRYTKLPRTVQEALHQD